MVLSCPFLSFAGKGFLGKSSLVSINASEMVTQKKLNISYNLILKRSFSIGLYYAYMDNDFPINNGKTFKYIANVSSTGEKVNLNGALELKIAQIA